MFVSDKFVFLELHKTGCTHVRKILTSLIDGELIGKHNQAGPELFTGNRFFLGSVRDPWEWYTSLWAYGCDNKGALFQSVTQRLSIRGLGWRSNPYTAFITFIANLSKNTKEWRDTYKNVNDAEAFRTWLHMVHDAKHLSHIGEGYGACPVSRTAGLMTFRYLTLFCTKLGDEKNLNELLTFEQIKNYENENCFIDHFIRNENLESDLFDGLEMGGEKISDNVKSEIMSRSKSNVSSRKHKSEYYYNAESENLVAERERLIIEKFGYVAPSMRGVA